VAKQSKPPAKKAKAPAKPAKKPTLKPKPAAKSPAKTPPRKPAPKAPAKPDLKKAKPPAKPLAKTDAKKAPAALKVAPKQGDSKVPPGKKGITVVEAKVASKKVKAPSAPMPLPPGVGRLLDGKGPRKPLIPSGPKAAHSRPLGQHGGYMPETERPQAKSPFSPEELAQYRELLLQKRSVLLADVKGMEDQALQSGSSGSLSNMPSHIAEQGSEAYDQSLSLDLAAADRRIIREIDDAIARIDAGTFGVCELTGKPIKLERLKELPWARHSIEAAREIERQSMRG
jgi:RNA polymerase-binding transcription factor DksA